MSGVDRDHTAQVVAPVFRVCLRHTIESNHRDLRRGNGRQTADRPEFLIVQINRGIRIGLIPVEARLAPIGEKI